MPAWSLSQATASQIGRIWVASCKRPNRPFSRSLACARDVDESAHLRSLPPHLHPVARARRSHPHPAALPHRPPRLHPHPALELVGATRIPPLRVAAGAARRSSRRRWPSGGARQRSSRRPPGTMRRSSQWPRAGRHVLRWCRSSRRPCTGHQVLCDEEARAGDQHHGMRFVRPPSSALLLNQDGVCELCSD